MKILVLGLDCAAPELLLGYEDLPNIRRLMEVGCYGRLESVIPPITVPAWMCLATSQDPGSLGVYGFRNRTDHSYSGLGIASSRSITEPAIWDHIAREGKRSIIVGVPPGYPPRRINGLSVSCFLTPDTDKNVFTHPPELSDEIRKLVGHYPVDAHGFRTDDKAWLRDAIFAMSRTQFQVVRHLIQNKEWDYFHFVDIGLDRIHHGFWKYHDPQHVLHEPDSPFRETVHDYYRHLDVEIGKVLELLSDDTIVLLVSDHGAAARWRLLRQRVAGARGAARPQELPQGGHPVRQAGRRLGEDQGLERGGLLCPRVLQREGAGAAGDDRAVGLRILPRRDQGEVRGDGRPRGEADGHPRLQARADLSRVQNVAPDLIVHFGALYWRSIGGVGYPTIHVLENDTGPDDCNHAQFGAFVLAARGPAARRAGRSPAAGHRPTLMDLAGYEVPASMQGRSLAAGVVRRLRTKPVTTPTTRPSSATASAGWVISAD